MTPRAALILLVSLAVASPALGQGARVVIVCDGQDAVTVRLRAELESQGVTRRSVQAKVQTKSPA